MWEASSTRRTGTAGRTTSSLRGPGGDDLAGLEGQPRPKAVRRAAVRPKPAGRPPLGLLVVKRHVGPRHLGREAIAPRVLRVRNHGTRFDGNQPESGELHAGGNRRRGPPMAGERFADRFG